MDHVSVLSLSFALFVLGILGIVLNTRTILNVIISVELMLLAINLGLLTISASMDDVSGQLFALFILTVAAAESAIGLALLVVHYRARGSISIDMVTLLRG
jgi:NADH-quinone oxidoreductase subunit K